MDTKLQNLGDSMRILIAALLSLSLVTSANAVTYINSGSTFPMVLSTQNETYELTENITCDTTCFYVKNTGITIDGGGFTMTFGNANNPGIQNVNFANWTDATTPTNWTVVIGTATRVASTWPFKSYDAEISATAVIKSGTVSLKANQTYMFYSWIAGNSADSYTITVNSAADDSVLATKTISGAFLSRGFAAENGELIAGEQRYKPTSDIDVYLEIAGSGSYTKRIAFADIKPEKHIGIAHHSYWNSAYFPDGQSSYFGSTAAGLTVKNMDIVQGAGQSIKAAGLFILGNAYTGLVKDVTISMSGRNSSSLYVYPTGNFVVDNVDSTTTSDANLNRMHAPPGFRIAPATTGTGHIEVKNCEILNDPEMAILYAANAPPTNMQITGSIHDNILRQKEQVTEGYAIAVTNVKNMDISYNTIQPYRGRGIISDTSGTAWVDGLEIHHNTITDLYEAGLFEYTVYGLEPVGIRLRNWGDDPLKNVSIHDNLIEGSTDSNGAHGIFGININSYHPNDDISIYNNTINIDATGPELYFGAGISLQIADYSENDGPLVIQNNTITTTGLAVGIYIGGSDNAGVYDVKNVDIIGNIISSESDTIRVWDNNYIVDDVNIYCNQLTKTGTSGYPFYLQGTIGNLFVDYNQITNGNSGGYEVYLTGNESSDVLFYGNGTIDVYGGGSVGAAGSATNGSSGCYSTAGVTEGDIFKPSTSASPLGGTYTSAQTVSLTCTDNVGCTGTYYCLGSACTPTTSYSSALNISSSSILRFYSTDGTNDEITKQETYTINIESPPEYGNAMFNGSGNLFTGAGIGTITLQ